MPLTDEERRLVSEGIHHLADAINVLADMMRDGGDIRNRLEGFIDSIGNAQNCLANACVSQRRREARGPVPSDDRCPDCHHPKGSAACQMGHP